MKRIICGIGLCLIFELSSWAQTLSEQFDWGSGVDGRVTISEGQSVGGQTVQAGDVSWICNIGEVVFSGTEGVGNGTASMSGDNAILQCGYTVTGQVSAVMEYVYQNAETNGIDGVWFGFSSNGSRLLNNALYARIYIRLQPKTGNLIAGVSTLSDGSLVDNLTKSTTLGGFSEGDRLTMTLTVDTDALSAQAIVSNITQGVSGSLTFGWTEPGISLNSLVVNETASQTIQIDSINVSAISEHRSGLFFVLTNRLPALDVYVFAGQSNMAGAGEKASLPEELQAAQTNVFLFDGNSWPVLEPTATGVGPEISFAYEMQATSNVPIGIILYAVGGSNLENDWDPESNDSLYAALINMIEEARQTREIHVRGMLWMQGENDSRYEDMAVAYGQNLTNLIQHARADFGGELMPFVAGRVNPDYPYVDLVREAIALCSMPEYSWVNCDDLTKNPDNLHYDTAGQVELGKRFASQLLEIK